MDPAGGAKEKRVGSKRQHYAQVVCIPCKKAKARCHEIRPCERCVAKKQQSLCVVADEDQGRVNKKGRLSARAELLLKRQMQQREYQRSREASDAAAAHALGTGIPSQQQQQQHVGVVDWGAPANFNSGLVVPAVAHGPATGGAGPLVAGPLIGGGGSGCVSYGNGMVNVFGMPAAQGYDAPQAASSAPFHVTPIRVLSDAASSVSNYVQTPPTSVCSDGESSPSPVRSGGTSPSLIGVQGGRAGGLIHTGVSIPLHGVGAPQMPSGQPCVHPLPSIPFRGNHLAFHDAPVPNVVLPYGILKMLWEYGFNPEELRSIFCNLPPKLNRVVWPMFTAAEKMVSQLASAKPPADMPRDDGSFSKGVLQAWERSDRVGVCAFGYDHARMRRSHFFINKPFAEAVGQHAEEIVGRVGDKTMPFSGTELGTFLTIMDDLLSFGQKHMLRYRAWKQLGGRDGIVLLRGTYEREFDALGRCVRATMYAVHVTPEEWDEAARVRPECVMPFFREMGDTRTGHDFLHGMSVAEWDKKESIRNMARDPEGLAKLDRLADVLEAKLAPILAQAGMGSGGGDAAPAPPPMHSGGEASTKQGERICEVLPDAMEVES